MADRAFPVIFATSVERTVAFYEQLGFRAFFQLPPTGEPGYVGLRRATTELAIVSSTWPADHYARPAGSGPTFEMFIYVDDIDAVIRTLGDRTTVLRGPADMAWGERVAYVTDPDDNPVALATTAR